MMKKIKIAKQKKALELLEAEWEKIAERNHARKALPLSEKRRIIKEKYES